MSQLARPDVDSLEGLTTAILVDQERLSANIRSTVGTASDANALPAHAVQPHGRSADRPAERLLVQHAQRQGLRARSSSSARGNTKRQRAEFNVLGGMCPGCDGTGRVSDLDLAQLYDGTKSINEGAILVPGLQGRRLERAVLRRVGLLRPRQARERLHRRRARRDFLHRDEDEGQDRRHEHDLSRGSCRRCSSRC